MGKVNVFDTLPFTVKVVAALSSLIPLMFTFEQFSQRLSPSQREVVENPLVVGIVVLGTAYSACGDTRASVYAVVIAAVFVSMYDDMIDGIKKKSEPAFDGIKEKSEPA